MNLPYFIAKRVAFSKHQTFSKLIIRIAVVAVTISMAVMIITTSLIRGFKHEISDKIFSFWGHIDITDQNSNMAFESVPIDREQTFIPLLDSLKQITYLDQSTFLGIQFNDALAEYQTAGGIAHIQEYALKSGIIQTKEAIEGIILKGISSDFNWESIGNFIEEGDKLDLVDSTSSRDIIISRQTADRMKLGIGDKFRIYFIKKNDQIPRVFQVKGIYKTGLEEYDRRFALVDIREIQKLLDWHDGQISGFEIFVDDLSDLDVLNEYIYIEVLPPKFYSETIRRKFPTIFEWLELQDYNEIVIIILMIAVSIINMITALMILILERTKMVGIMKALGQTNWAIRKIFLYHAAYIIIGGLLLGNFLGVLLCFLQEKFHFISLSETDYYLSYAPIELNFFTIFLLNIGTIVLTLLFLIIPSYIVTSVSPVKAIRFK